MKSDIHKKSTAILKEILDLCNEHTDQVKGTCPVQFQADWGKNTLTIFVNEYHTHVGNPDNGSFEDLVDGLYNLLVEGKGLSWSGG